MATFALLTTVWPEPRPARSTSVNLAARRTVKLLPAFLIWLIHKPCTIGISGGQVSSCQRTHTRAPLFGVGDTRAVLSHRIAKDAPDDPDILSLRHDCPTLAGVSGKWYLIDGMSTIATGSFLAGQPDQGIFSRPFLQVFHGLLFSSIHCYLDPSSGRPLYTRIARLLAGRWMITSAHDRIPER